MKNYYMCLSQFTIIIRNIFKIPDMSMELALISPVFTFSKIPKMRLALGLLDISAIKKSARE